MNPLSTFFPFVIEYNLCKPYTTIEKNCVELRAVLKRFLDRSSDETSVYKQLVNKYNINEAQALQDIMSLLFAGHDTTSHAIGSAAYFLKAYPDSFEKLKSEFDKIGINQHSDFSSEEVKQKIQDCDYLLYVTKEVLRMDPPTFRSISYNTYNSFDI